MTAQQPISHNADHQNVEVKPRHMSFPFKRVENQFFFDNNSLLSTFFASLSSTFPPGEAEFIASVRLYKDQVTEPNLSEQIRGFIGQEAHHSLQHKRANEVLRDLGLDAVALEKKLERDIAEVHKRKGTPKFRLALTVGLEHLTANMAEHVLNNPEVLDPLEEPIRDLLYWHAVEEIEHKAVAFDVYMQCEGDRKHLRKVLRMITVLFSVRITMYMVGMLWQNRTLPNWRDIKGFWRFMIGNKQKPGLLRSIRKPYMDYFKPDFHPWDHANEHLITKWKHDLYRADRDKQSEEFVDLEANMNPATT